MRRWAVAGVVVASTQTAGGCDELFRQDAVPLGQSIPVALTLGVAWLGLVAVGARWYWRRSRRWPEPTGAVAQRAIAVLWPAVTLLGAASLVISMAWDVAFDYRTVHSSLFSWGGLVTFTVVIEVVALAGAALAVFLAVGVWRRRQGQLIVMVVLAAWSTLGIFGLVRNGGDLWVWAGWAVGVVAGAAAASLLPGSLRDGAAAPACRSGGSRR